MYTRKHSEIPKVGTQSKRKNYIPVEEGKGKLQLSAVLKNGGSPCDTLAGRDPQVAPDRGLHEQAFQLRKANVK